MSELDEELARLAREITDEDRDLLEPPEDLRASILSAARETTESTRGVQRDDGAGGGGDVIAMDSRRTGLRAARWTRVLAGAAAAAILVLVTVVVVTDRDDDGEVLAAAEIVNEGLPVPADEDGTATLVDDDGTTVVDLDLPDLPAVDGYYEVWLIDTDVEGMVSLGVASGDGRLTVPPGVDPADFPIVDISVEPVDGDPTHSGQSILRGRLDV